MSSILKTTLENVIKFVVKDVACTGEYTHIVKRRGHNITVDGVKVPFYSQVAIAYCILYGTPLYIDDGETLYVCTVINGTPNTMYNGYSLSPFFQSINIPRRERRANKHVINSVNLNKISQDTYIQGFNSEIPDLVEGVLTFVSGLFGGEIGLGKIGQAFGTTGIALQNTATQNVTSHKCKLIIKKGTVTLNGIDFTKNIQQLPCAVLADNVSTTINNISDPFAPLSINIINFLGADLVNYVTIAGSLSATPLAEPYYSPLPLPSVDGCYTLICTIVTTVNNYSPPFFPGEVSQSAQPPQQSDVIKYYNVLILNNKSIKHKS
jgi:hypothetical protein